MQLPPEGEPDETGMKEAIVPVDLNLITGRLPKYCIPSVSLNDLLLLTWK